MANPKWKMNPWLKIPLCSIKRKINKRHLLSVFASSGGETRVQSQTSTRNKDPESHMIILWSWAVYQHWGSQRLIFCFWDLNIYISSLLFIDLTTAVIHGGELHCLVLTYSTADCWLELKGKYILTIIVDENLSDMSFIHITFSLIPLWLSQKLQRQASKGNARLRN